MKCFQFLNNEILIINGDKMYKDSPDNFIIDGGSLKLGKVTLSAVIYDDQQSHAVVNGEFCDKPISAIEDKIAAIDAYIAAKATREYVPPTLEELREQALNYQYQKYEAQKHAIVWLNDGSGYGFDCGDDDQNNWQVALTLMVNDITMYRVYIDENNLSKKSFLEVTREQMMEAGNLVKAQQYEAYSGFEKVRAEIANCTTAEQLKPYLPTESA
ncbi:hypothetical protein [uncultured Phascolarctobacterium sp.]|uniref:hypothetical protein n=1 Tax=uncultured Phascolarctobacterium sp. TaxID=512296 RepID=UPI002603F201|nr:hypothetical protein [uncultured Phascolarctobacterium sp.]